MSATISATLRSDGSGSLLALLLGFGLMQMGNTLQGTLLSIRGAGEGFSSPAIGAVGAAFWVGITLGSLLGGRLIRRVGHIRTFAALGAIAADGPLFHLLAIDPAAWIACARAHRLLLRGLVHGRRELAQRRRDRADARAHREASTA